MPKHLATVSEERVHAWSHAAGVLLGLAALSATLVRALSGDAGPLALASGLVYGASLVALFGASTAYHATRSARAKRRWQKADHCAIYLLIAGTYTPFTLVALPGVWGASLFAVVWTLAGVGLALELLAQDRFERVALALYLIMGWLAVLAALPLVQAVAPAALGLLLAGGLLYTVGTVFYARNQPWDHAIWHGFVLGGAGAHAVAVLGFVL